MWTKTISVISLGLGVFLMIQVLMPIASYGLWEISHNNQNVALLDPTVSKRGEVLGVSVETRDGFSALVSDKKREIPATYNDFTVHIPKINIDGAMAVVDSNEFNFNLAHLPGSALPGEKGNVFVTGHSSLTQFFRQDNYKAIFANLPKLDKGDEIFINAGGTEYKYVVEGLRVVDPSEVWVINPPDNEGRYLTLMTCVPPGLSTKRLIVLARLK
jgi:LPXTG-site transpeptidase (sortase) family protein